MNRNGAASAAGPEIAAWSADVFAARRVPPAQKLLAWTDHPHPARRQSTSGGKRERVPEANGPGAFSRLREKAEDEGGAAAGLEAKGDVGAISLEAVKQPPATAEAANVPEAVKQAETLDDVATDEMLAVPRAAALLPPQPAAAARPAREIHLPGPRLHPAQPARRPRPQHEDARRRHPGRPAAEPRRAPVTHPAALLPDGRGGALSCESGP
jgi:hypothetical protein